MRKALLLSLALSSLCAPSAHGLQDFTSGECGEEVRSLLYSGADADTLKDAYRRMYQCRSASTCPLSNAELDFLAGCDDYGRLQTLSRELAAQRGAPQLGPELKAKAFGGCSPTQLETGRSLGLFLSRFVDPDGDEGPKPGLCLNPNELTEAPPPGANERPEIVKEEVKAPTVPVPATSSHATLSATYENGTSQLKEPYVYAVGPGKTTTVDSQRVTVSGKGSARVALVTFKDSLNEPWGPSLAAEGHRFFAGIVVDPALEASASLSVDEKKEQDAKKALFKDYSILERLKLSAGHVGVMIRHQESNGSWSATYEILPVDLLVVEKDKILNTSIVGSKIGLARMDISGISTTNLGVIAKLDLGAYVGEQRMQSHETNVLSYGRVDLGLGREVGEAGDIAALISMDFKGQFANDDSQKVTQNMTTGTTLVLKDVGRTKAGATIAMEWLKRGAISDFEEKGSQQIDDNYFGVRLEFAPKFDLGGAETGL